MAKSTRGLLRWLNALLIVAIVVSIASPIPTMATNTATIYSSTADGYILGQDTVYGTARTSPIAVYDTFSFIGIGQEFLSPYYIIHRGYVYFDTSAIPSSVTITSATLSLYGLNDLTGGSDFNIQIQNGMSTYPHDPLALGDFALANYSGNGGTLSTATFAIGAYNDIALNVTGLSWINKGGITKLLLASDRDLAGTTPSASERVAVYSKEQGTSYAPKLTLTYSATPPAITTTAASNIGYTSARLNSTIIDDGGDTDNCSVRFGYGTTTQTAGNFNSYDNITAWQDSFSVSDNPFYDSSNLTQGTTYYYRAQIKNANSTVTSATEISFTTSNSIGNVTNLQAYPSATQIILGWTRATGSTRTLVMFRTDRFPTATNDGTQLYLGSDNTKTHESLTAGTLYYYAVWGESGGSYSSTNATIAMSTLAAGISTGSLSAPSQPNAWQQTPDETKLSKLEPWYSIMNAFADSWGMPRNNFWLGTWILICVILGIGTYVVFKSFGGSATITLAGMFILTMIGLMPSWMIFFEIIAALGVFSFSRESLGL